MVRVFAARSRASASGRGLLAAVLTVLVGGGVLEMATAPVAGSAPASGWTASDLWLAPLEPTPVRPPLAVAVADLAAGQAARALPVFNKLTGDPVLGGYALLYVGRAQMSLNRWDDAGATAQQLLAKQPAGYLGDAALWLAADAAENRGDWPTAVQSLRALTAARPISPERAWVRLGRAAEHAGDKATAALAFSKLYYDYPLTPEADEVAADVARLPSPVSRTPAERRQLDLARAQQLFGAHRYADARKAFDALRAGATGDERADLQVRLAECDLNLKHYLSARDALRPFTTQASPRQAEAVVAYASTLREGGRGDDYVAYVRKFVDGDTGGPFVEQALNDLATYDIKIDDAASAAAVFAEMYRRFPTGTYAERAAWRAGWWAYRNGTPGEAIRVFESAAASLGRVDRRPAFIYWAARAHVQRGERDAAAEGFRQVVTDYRNSYYGRLAQRDLEALGVPVRGGGPYAEIAEGHDLPPIAAGTPPPNADIIRRLLAAGLYDAAVGELRKVQVEAGTSPLIEATIAYALNRKGDLRPAITAMRRAYPQFIAEGGEALPTEMLAVIFPINYWDLIGQHATARKLDPFLMAALIAQESTFDTGARSAASAYGLMQILPSTGRQYARELGIRPFTTAKLTDPSVNVRIGTAYFSDLVDRFGEVTLALAAYNAGEQRVAHWQAERPGLGRDEFVEDIPYQETQNYVKRIVGTAEDYRALYRVK